MVFFLLVVMKIFANFEKVCEFGMQVCLLLAARRRIVLMIIVAFTSCGGRARTQSWRQALACV